MLQENQSELVEKTELLTLLCGEIFFAKQFTR